MPREIASASRHAVERYHRHYPDAHPRDLLAAVALAQPISQEIARALVGRNLSTAGGITDEYRLHPEGRGIFVLCPVAQDPSQSFVRTYLRLDTYEQQRMARAWFLDPVRVLRQAFELGFEAARQKDAPALAMQASEAAAETLSALAPRMALSLQPESPTAPPPPPVPTLHPPAEYAPGAEHELVEGPAGLVLHIPQRIQGILDWFVESHPSFVADLTLWQVLPPQSVALVTSFSHVPSTPICGGLLEPSAQAIALLANRDRATEILSLTNVPRKQRGALLVAATQHTARPLSSASPSTAPALHETVELVPRLVVGSWSVTARKEAESCGLGFIPPSYLNDLDEVPPSDVPTLAELAGWQLRNAGRYALLRYGSYVLLLRQHGGAEAATVLRCSRLDEPS